MKHRLLHIRPLFAAVLLTSTSAHAVVPVLDAVNATSNIFQNFQLKAIKKSLTNPKGLVVQNTTNIDNSTKVIKDVTTNIDRSTVDIRKYTELNFTINNDFTWIINKDGEEIIPIPRGLESKLEAIHGSDLDKYTGNFKDAVAHLGGVEAERPKEIFEGSRVRKAANDMMVHFIDLERSAMQGEIEALEMIKKKGEKAEGHGHQLQVANALSLSQVNQMMKLRNTLMIAETQRAAEAQVTADRDARAIATGVKMRRGLTQAISASPGLTPAR